MRKSLLAILFATAVPVSAHAASGGGYSLTIPQGSEGVGGRVSLSPAGSYQICLRSDRAEPADVELIVDGGFYGAYRVSAYGTLCLDRPVAGGAFFRPGADDRITARFAPVVWKSGPGSYYTNGWGWTYYVPGASREERDYSRAVTLSLHAVMRGSHSHYLY